MSLTWNIVVVGIYTAIFVVVLISFIRGYGRISRPENRLWLYLGLIALGGYDIAIIIGLVRRLLSRP